MKVIEICEISTVDTPITVRGNGEISGLKYKVPSKIKDADTEVMNMEVVCIEMEFGQIVLHVGNVNMI